MNETRIELRNVSLRYPSGPAALHNVSVSLEAGTLHFLTGRSGAGKSSLLRLLYLAQRPTAGSLTLFGRDAARLSRRDIALMRRRIGVVFQDFQLLDHLSVFENVALPLVIAGRREAEYRANVLEMLEWVKLNDRIDQKPPRLSGGEKQRVAIARAMVTAPDVIIADEPTGSVDRDMGARIMALFHEMHRLGRTVLIATHDLDLVIRSRAPRLHLEGGRLIPEPNTASFAARRRGAAEAVARAVGLEPAAEPAGVDAGGAARTAQAS